MPSLTEVRGRLDAKRKHLDEIRREVGPDWDLSQCTLLDGDSQQKMAYIRALDAEIDALAVEEGQLAHMARIASANQRELEMNGRPTPLLLPGSNGTVPLESAYGSKNGGAAGRFQASLRAVIEGNESFKAFKAGHASNATIDFPGLDFKTLVTLATISPQNVRQPDIVQMALEERTVADLMLEGTIDRGVVEYYEETTFTNAATGVAEGSAKPESAEGFTLRSETARKLAHNIPATKESLDDNSFLESQLRGRLAFGIKRVEEQQLLTGSGAGPNLLGLLNRSGIQTTARATGENNADAIYRAMQLVRGTAGLGFAEPTNVIVNPVNWTPIRLLKTTEGLYIWGHPSDPGPDRLWGIPVRQTTAMTANTALVGAFRPWAEILRREGITITMSTEHSTFFVENKVMLQAEERLALACYRPSAFCTVTNLN